MNNLTENQGVKLIGTPPTLVAHRGYSGQYPENTLLAYQAAYEQGARFMELDLQMTSDNEPVLHHDISLQRMAGIDLDVREISTDRFKTYNANYGERFLEEYSDNTFTTFAEFCTWLKSHPGVTIFVEMKQDSINHFGLEIFMDRVYQCIADANVEKQCVIISFNHKVIAYSRALSSMPIGWVLPRWSEINLDIAKQTNPEYLFCDKNFLPSEDEDIWPGDWQWAIYNLDDVESAIKMANRGIPILETNQIGTLLAADELKS